MKKRPPDFILFLTVLTLLAIGIIMVFSASKYPALVRYGDGFYYVKRQLLWALIGISAMFIAMNFDYWKLKRWAKPALLAALVLLILVLVPGIGRSSHDAQRWIGLGPLNFQPSEFVKLSIIIFTAYGLSLKGRLIFDFSRGLLPYLIILGVACGLILLQPDLGTAISLAGSVFILLFAAGVRLTTLAGLSVLGLAAASAAIYVSEYRRDRILSFLNPWADPQGEGFHIIQSLYAIGSGGLFGLGLGQSRQQFLYLPESHTDFIFSILSEEFGFIGACTVILLFMIFVWRGLRISLVSPDPFASLLAAGITAGIVLQAIINIGVVTGSMPITGITLPFVSFGGTSLLFTMIGVGILLNISRYTTPR